jgi:hypothetical protein
MEGGSLQIVMYQPLSMILFKSILIDYHFYFNSLLQQKWIQKIQSEDMYDWSVLCVLVGRRGRHAYPVHEVDP